MSLADDPVFVDGQITDRLRSWLARFNYKPEYSFKIVNGDPKINAEGLVLHLVARVPDACTVEQEEIVVVHRRPIPDEATRDFESFESYFRAMVHSAEIHEADEWLRIDGEQKYYPHVVNLE